MHLFLQEKMISGVTGEEMPCDIYIGVVYYQRLRHMVSDKFQVSLNTRPGHTTKGLPADTHHFLIL